MQLRTLSASTHVASTSYERKQTNEGRARDLLFDDTLQPFLVARDS